MNRRVWMMLGLLTMVSMSVMAKDAGAEKKPSLRVVLEMADGSRLVGTPAEKSLRLDTEYMKVEIPLAKIRQCDVRHQEERVVLTLQNGDKLTGVLEMNQFRVVTSLGKLAPEFAQIDRLTFSTSQPASQPPEPTGVWTSAEVAAPDSIEGQLRTQGKHWVRTTGEITVGAYVQDILEGRLNQPKGRGAIGKVLSLNTVNGRPAGAVEFGRGYSVPMFLSEVCLVRLIKVPPQPLNLDFGVWKPNPSPQTGPAAAGRKGDFWNAVAVPWNNAHTQYGLKSATGDPSPVRVEMNNLGGGWSSGGGMGVKAPMLDTFNYPVNNRGGNSQVILHQVPPGKYDLYLYGHKPEPLYYGDYTLTVGGHSYGRKTTFHEDDSGQNTEWVEGSQYVKFAGIKVAPGDKIDILIRPGGETTVGRLSAQGVLEMNIQVPVQEGEMLEQKRHTGPGTATWGGGDGGSGPIGPNFHSGPSKMRMVPGGIRRTFADAMICGLQLIPVK